VGDNWTHGQCNVGNWTDIVQVAAGGYHTLGLQSGGTVLAVGNYEYDQCDVGKWTGIIQVAGGSYHTVGLKSNGRVVAVGYNDYGQCDVGEWRDIIAVSAGYGHTVGLRSNGAVIAVGHDDYGQCGVDNWTDIVQVAAGSYHTVGLKSDGTVLAAGLEVELGGWNLGEAALYLTISSTTGGEVTGPGQGVFPYYPGRLLNLMARPEDGYRFVSWVGDVGTIADIRAAQTTIAMNGDYSVTANFAEKPAVNWGLIGGIIGAVVIAGVVIFFARRKRGTAARGR